MTEPDREREIAKEQGYDVLVPIDLAYERGEITKDEWHDRIRAVIERAYLAGTTEQMGSGHSGTAEDWSESRGLIT